MFAGDSRKGKLGCDVVAATAAGPSPLRARALPARGAPCAQGPRVRPAGRCTAWGPTSSKCASRLEAEAEGRRGKDARFQGSTVWGSNPPSATYQLCLNLRERRFPHLLHADTYTCILHIFAIKSSWVKSILSSRLGYSVNQLFVIFSHLCF